MRAESSQVVRPDLAVKRRKAPAKRGDIRIRVVLVTLLGALLFSLVRDPVRNPVSAKDSDRAAQAQQKDARGVAVRPSSSTVSEPPAPALVLQTSQGGIGSVAFSPNGRWLASGHGTGIIQLREVSSGRVLRTLRGGNMVTFSPDGRLLATAKGRGGTYYRQPLLVEVETGRVVLDLRDRIKQTINAVAFSSDGRLLAMGGDGPVTLWDIAGNQEVTRLPAFGGNIYAVEFSPNGRLLAAGGWDRTGNSAQVKLWDIATGSEMASLEGGNQAMAFSPDGRLLAVGAWDKARKSAQVKLWDIASGSQLSILQGSGYETLAFSPDSRFLAAESADKTVVIWDVSNGQAIRSLKGHTDEIIDVAFSPDGRLLVSASRDRTARLWDVATGQEIRTLKGDTEDVRAVSFHPDTQMLATAAENTIRLWDVDSAEVRTLTGHRDWVTSVAFSSDGRLLASGSKDKAVILWNAASGQKVRSLENHATGVSSVAFSPDGRLLATATQYLNPTTLWDITTGLKVRTLDGGVCAAFSPDGRLLANSYQLELASGIMLWEVATGRQSRFMKRGGSGSVVCIDFSRDGRLLATGDVDGHVEIWEVATGRQVRSLEKHLGMIHSVSFSPDGRQVASASEDSAVVVWDVDTSEATQILRHNFFVYSVSFSRNGRFLASGGLDGTTRIWDLSTGRLVIYLLSMKGRDDWLTVTRDGLFDGSEQGMQQLVAWRIRNRVYPPDRFFADFYTPRLLSQIFAGKQPKPAIDLTQLNLPPDVRIISPVNNLISEEGRIGVTVESTDLGGGVAEVSLYHNGKLVQTQPGKSGERSSCTFQVDLVSGENVLKTTASSNQRIESNEDWVRVNYKAPETRQSVLHLLAAGISQYEDSAFTLGFARADAEAVQLYFDRHGSSLFRSVSSNRLVDHQATKENIVLALDRLAKETGPDDVVLVYMAGHGVAVGQQFYFLTHGMRTEADEEAAIRKYGITASGIGDALQRAKALKQILILDTCQSEAALPILAKAVFFRGRGPEEEKALKMLARSNGIYLLAASTQQQSAFENAELGHGVLTYALLNALGEKGPPKALSPGERMVTIKSLIAYVNRQVPDLTEKYFKGRKQYPVSYEAGMDFPLPHSDKVQ